MWINPPKTPKPTEESMLHPSIFCSAQVLYNWILCTKNTSLASKNHENTQRVIVCHCTTHSFIITNADGENDVAQLLVVLSAAAYKSAKCDPVLMIIFSIFNRVKMMCAWPAQCTFLMVISAANDKWYCGLTKQWEHVTGSVSINLPQIKTAAAVIICGFRVNSAWDSL